ncbi:MAG: DUF3887 domain-containing protein [Peptostreptococcaceae bacterium]|nr:DUF3887 domain-containing protein [Peptostreptococcaceae bacterium]
MKKVIKLFLITALVLIPALLITSCDSEELPEGFDKDDVTEAAKAVVNAANSRNYDVIHARISEEFQDAISVKELKEAWDPLLDESGNFEEFDEVILASKAGEEDSVYALALVKCKYENGERTYTFYFDEDMTLSGLWMK